jgi:hypothetical protein
MRKIPQFLQCVGEAPGTNLLVKNPALQLLILDNQVMVEGDPSE